MSREEQAQNRLPTPSIQSSEQIAFLGDSFTPAEWPKANWWEAYDSLELNALIEIALQKNPSIQAAQEKIALAKAQATIVRSELFPLLYFDANDQWEYLSKNGLYRALNSSIPLNSSQIDFSLSFSYEFDFWGKHRNLYKAAIGRQKAAFAESAQVELITATSLAQAYFALKTNLLRKALYEELYQVRLSYFQLQNQLLEHSLYSKLIPLLSEEAVFQAQQWLYEITKEIEVGLHLVNILAGRGPDEPLDLGEDLSALPSRLSLPTDISIELLSRRPDLMAQIWKVDAFAHEVGAAKADFWPNINLTALAGFQSGSWSQLFDWASKTIGAIPGLVLPVYTAGKIGANVSGKKAIFNEAVYQYNDLVLHSFSQVADLIAIGRSVYEKKKRQEQIVANAQERYDLTLLRQEQKLDSGLVLYTFLEELIQKELDDVQLLYEQYLVSINLTKALGGGYLSSERIP